MMMAEARGDGVRALQQDHSRDLVWTNPNGTLKGVGPGTELDWYVQRLRAADPGIVKIDLCKQMLGPEGNNNSFVFSFFLKEKIK